MPSISVLMPCYNAVETLDEALESLSRQTFSDFEIVAVDDGSTDGTLQLLEAWAVRESRLRLFSRPHGGLVSALNAGLEACSAPFVARMDGDDRSHPERLALQVAYLQTHPQVGVVSCRVKGFPAGQVRQGFKVYIEWLNSLLSNEDIRREMFVESPLPHPSVVFRREVVIDAGGYQEHGWPEDYDLWLRLYLKGVGFAKLPETLLEWREHPGRLTRTDGRYSVENFLRAKAYYLGQGPLAGRDAVIVWGAGMMGRRLSKHLARQEAPLAAFVDIDPKKIGRTLRGLPIIPAQDLLAWWRRYDNPAALAAVGSRGARQLIRQQLVDSGLREAQDWWCVA
jgi:glycosyltransferase involved in cell wall biosynthesis